MTKITAAMVGFLMLTGCACTRKAKESQLRQALHDTNLTLSQCRDENVELHKVVEAQHKQLVLVRRSRQTDAFKKKGGHR